MEMTANSSEIKTFHFIIIIVFTHNSHFTSNEKRIPNGHSIEHNWRERERETRWEFRFPFKMMFERYSGIVEGEKCIQFVWNGMFCMPFHRQHFECMNEQPTRRKCETISFRFFSFFLENHHHRLTQKWCDSVDEARRKRIVPNGKKWNGITLKFCFFFPRRGDEEDEEDDVHHLFVMFTIGKQMWIQSHKMGLHQRHQIIPEIYRITNTHEQSMTMAMTTTRDILRAIRTYEAPEGLKRTHTHTVCFFIGG